MNRCFSYLILTLISINFLSAQTNVILDIQHMWGDNKFGLNKKVLTGKGVSHKITRLDYFLSNITIYHDGNQKTTLPDTYIFIENCKDFTYDLGNFNVQKIDSISLGIGVDPLRNHADPSVWPSDHALSLLTSDMHWGWTGGYRFVALEGKNVDDMTFQIHALGDPLMRYANVSTPDNQIVNGNLHVKLDADMSFVTRDLDMHLQIWEHGESREAGLVMNAFGKNVYKPRQNTSSSDEIVNSTVNVYPNPSLDGFFHLNAENSYITHIVLTDLQGRQIRRIDLNSGQASFDIDRLGTYFLVTYAGSRKLETKRIVRQ